MTSDDSGPSSDLKRPVRRWGVIGGGITGLAAAWELQQSRPQDSVTLFEGTDRLGGILGTERVGDWLIEQAADMMVTDPDDGIALCRELGLADELIPTDKAKRGALVAWNGKLHRIPEGFSLMAPSAIWPILTTGLLSLKGKWRLAQERFVARRNETSDESFESFAIRRCGREAYDRLIQPLVSGIYTADPKKLSMQATSLKRFVDFERDAGSLTRGLIRQSLKSKDRSSVATGARYGMFVAPRDGMQALINRLAERLGSSIRRNSPVTDLRPVTASSTASSNEASPQWRVSVHDQSENFDGVVIATNAPRTAALTRTFDTELAKQIGAIEHASCAVVVLGLRNVVGAPPVFGVVVPNAAERPMIAAALASHKFPGRAPADGLLVRVFFGGALNEAITKRPDDELIALAIDELRKVLKLRGEVEVSRVVRWLNAMPQYHVGHLDRVAEIDQRVAIHSGLEIAGNAFHGVGIPDCVRAGREAARRCLQ